MPFTDKLIKSLKQKKTRYDLRETNGNGFAIRVFPSGKKSWVFLYTFEGRKRRLTLGNYPKMKLKDAREEHRNQLSILTAKKDPGLEKINKKNEARDSYTVKALIDEYIRIWAKPRKRSWEEDQRILKRNIEPIWGKRKASSIVRRDVNLLLDSIKERAPIAANRTLACIRRMFNFAIERDIIPTSPCTAIKAPSKENQCSRCLTVEEIKTFWHSLEDRKNTVNMSPQTKLALKLQLVTAQRKGEIIGAEWKDMDLINRVWTIPAEKAKNNNPHRVLLSDFAMELLKEIKILSGDSHWLFPAPKLNSYKKILILANNANIPKTRKKETLYLLEQKGKVFSYTPQGKKPKILNDEQCNLLKKEGVIFLDEKIITDENQIKKITTICGYFIKNNHMTGEAVAKALLRSIPAIGTEPFTPHDIRRTGATHMTAMGISRLVVSKILNHVENSVTAVYDRHSYDTEKRNALEAWSKKLKEIIDGNESTSNVIPLKNAI